MSESAREKTEKKLMADTYESRNILLRKMGYSSYSEYLKSPVWKSIRLAVLRRDRWLCQVCGKGAFQVHHLCYNRGVLLGKDLGSLRSLCRDCHLAVEFTGEGGKRTLRETIKAYRRLCRKHLQR